MKVIFLDFNGVLDTNENCDVIDDTNLSILISAIKLTDSKIVITSSNKNTYYYLGRHNRLMYNLIKVLENYDVEVLGYTKLLETREEEILEYLKSHPEITNYCILDDDYFFESMKEHQIKLTKQMDGGNGLRETTTNEIVRRLQI